MSANEKPAGSRGCAYIRVSSSMQDATSQKDQVRAWLDQRGLTVQRWYVDSGGKNSRHEAEKRAEFQRLLADVRAGKWDWVIVDSQDRFGTKHEFERGEFMNLFVKAGCELWSARQGCLSDYRNPVAVLVGGIGSMQSRDEQLKIAGRVLRGKLNAAAEGRYPGGNVPFGYDVAVLGADGQEKWRVVILSRDAEGNLQRLKVWPDGREERYDDRHVMGENGRAKRLANFPSYDTTDVARYALSCRADRTEAARLMFAWFATEDVFLWTVAKRLNQLNCRPMSGKKWTARMVEAVLKNPIYLGEQAFGKEGQGDFMTYRRTPDGLNELVETPWARNEPVRDGYRPPEQWVKPREFRLPALVDRETWDRVQAKLAAIAGPAKPTRSEACWLKRFMVCAHCGRPMRAVHARTGRIGKQYFCGTWQDARLGAENPAGCLRHPVDHEVVERVVEAYLRETAASVEALTDGAGGEEVLNGLNEELNGHRQELLAVLDRMRAFIVREETERGPLPAHLYAAKVLERHGDRPEREFLERYLGAPGEPGWPLGSVMMDPLADLYACFYDLRRENLGAAVAAKEAELRRLVDAYADLPTPRARQLAKDKLEAVERELEELKARHEPLMERLDSVYNEVGMVKAQLAAARQALAGEDGRRKAEAVGRVIHRIVCHFRHTGGKGRNPASVLERVEIVPLAGDGAALGGGTGCLQSMWVTPSPHKKQGSLHV